MDFFTIKKKNVRKNILEIYPDFKVGRNKDIMIRGKAFYAIWDAEKELWSTDEVDVQRLVDKELMEYASNFNEGYDGSVEIRFMSSFGSKSWKEFKEYVKTLPDNYTQLDTNVMFQNNDISRDDYASIKLPYAIKKGKCPAYDEMMSVLYSDEEREKIEWAIGAIISGDSKKIQKFLVFYGDPGTGKSTVLDIIQKLFQGYYSTFEAKALTTSNNQFATETLKNNPLIAIQHDGDLSKIEDNTKLNSIISHEEITINEKYKSAYTMRLNTFLMIGTNKPVKITDAKAGIIRRLIDVRPTGNRIEVNRYLELKELINYELGAIAYRCKNVYEELGKNYYSKYKPVDMMFKTDLFYNFVESYEDEFTRDNSTTLKQAYTMYKQYCEESGCEHKMLQYIFREELKNYFEEYYERKQVGSQQFRNYYEGFILDKFNRQMEKTEKVKPKGWIELRNDVESQFDILCADCLAQYANEKETPTKKWENVTTKLSNIEPRELHYVRVPENHIVIDFDLKDPETGEKSLEKNLEAARKFPRTYVETSKSGNGLHLHYIYDGDVSMLSRVYDDNIEVKVFVGNSSLRRKLVMCNDIPIATINSGLPIKETSKNDMVDFEVIKSEKVLRTMIKKNLNKEYHKFTKPSIDFIDHLLNQAYDSGMKYDVSDMRQAVLIFATKSHNQADACIKIVNNMKFKSEEASDAIISSEEAPIVFYDVEVFPNLLIICWKKLGEDICNVMINPTADMVEELLQFRLVGHNCRRYDNHIIHARIMKYNEQQLFNLSQKIVNTKKGDTNNCFFGEAYNHSYADTLDYPTKKQSLKKWELELADAWNEKHPNMPIRHHELGLDWNKPVPEELWNTVADYCKDDVYATEAVWEATQADFRARQILVGICRHAGLSACENDTSNMLTTKIIFGTDRRPELIYTDLETGKQY